MDRRIRCLPPLPSVTPDDLLTRDELARLLCMSPSNLPALLCKPFAADPDAVPVRVALGLVVLFWLAQQNLEAGLAVHVAVNAMDADPAQHRFLVAGYQNKLPASAWITNELIATAAVDAALRVKGFALADKSYCPADLLMVDLLAQVGRMRAQVAA